MTSPATITGRGATMNAARTAGPHRAVTGTFALDHAGPAAIAPLAVIAPDPAGAVPPDGPRR